MFMLYMNCCLGTQSKELYTLNLEQFHFLVIGQLDMFDSDKFQMFLFYILIAPSYPMDLSF